MKFALNSDPEPDLHNINLYTKFGENPLTYTQIIIGENPLTYTQIIIQKWKYWRTDQSIADRRTDGFAGRSLSKNDKNCPLAILN